MNDAQLIQRLELLAELLDEDEEHSITQSAIVTPYRTNEACIDYFGLPSPHKVQEDPVAGPRAKTPDYLSQGFGERPSSSLSWNSETYLAPVKSENGSERHSDDAGSIAETLSEWGLDKVGDVSNEQSTPKRPSKSRTSLEEDEESGLAYLQDGEGEDEQRPASSLSHKAASYTRSRTTSAMSAYSASSRPGSALSRFDPGRSETPEERAERLEAEAERPVFSSPYAGRPKVLVMPPPLFEEGQAEDAAKRISKVVKKSPSNESLQVRERPAGKLYGLSLLDRLEQRKAEIKGRRRVFSGDNRIKMSDSHYDLSAPDSTATPADDSEPFLRFATHKAAAEASGRPVTGIFGRDMVLEKELEKLAKIRLVEEAQRKMDLERKRVDDATRAEREAKKKQKADRKGKKRETMPAPDYDLPPSPLRQELSIEPEAPISDPISELDTTDQPAWLPAGAPSLPPGSSFPESPVKSQYSDRYLSPPGTPSRAISMSLDFDPNFDPSFSPTSPSKQNPWALDGEGSPDKPFRASYASRSDELRKLWTTTSSDSGSDVSTDEGQDEQEGAVLADVLHDREEENRSVTGQAVHEENDDLPISSVVQSRRSQPMLEERKSKISYEPEEEGGFNLDTYLEPQATPDDSDSDASEHVPLGNRLSGTMWSNPQARQQQQPIPSINEQLDSDDEKPLAAASRRHGIDSDDEKPLASRRKGGIDDDDDQPLRTNISADNVPLGYARQSFVAQQQQQQWMQMQAMQMQAMQYQQHMMAVAYQQQQMAQQHSGQQSGSEIMGPPGMAIIPPAKLIDSVDAWRKDVDPAERQ